MKGFQFFIVEYVSSRFVINGLYYCDICSLYTNFYERCYCECMLNIIKCFFCIFWDDLSLVNVVYHMIALWILNHSCISGINPTWSCYMSLFTYCWIWFANIFLRICALVLIKNTGLQYSFLVVSLFDFGIRVLCLHRINLVVFHPLQFFGMD